MAWLCNWEPPQHEQTKVTHGSVTPQGSESENWWTAVSNESIWYPTPCHFDLRLGIPFQHHICGTTYAETMGIVARRVQWKKIQAFTE